MALGCGAFCNFGSEHLSYIPCYVPSREGRGGVALGLTLTGALDLCARHMPKEGVLEFSI